MSIILQTMITNKLKQDRTLRWAGKRGVHVKGESSVIVDGAYPTACRNPSSVKDLEAELTEGWTDITLITNLNTAKPVGKKGAVSNPAAVRAQSKAKEEIEATPLQEFKADPQERFVKKEDTNNPLEPEAKKLPGTEDLAIPEPVTKSMLPEDGKLIPQEGTKVVEVKEETPVEEVSETAPESSEEAAPVEEEAGENTTAPEEGNPEAEAEAAAAAAAEAEGTTEEAPKKEPAKRGRRKKTETK